MMHKWTLTLLSIATAATTTLGLTGLLRADPPAATQSANPTSMPTSQPATSQPASTLPPGFETIVIGNRTVFCEAADAPWVREVLEKAEATTMPTTMPTQMAESLLANRESLIKQMVADLALADDAAAKTFYDDRLTKAVQDMADLEAPIGFLVTTKARVKDAMKAGWRHPQFYYNRSADDVTVNTSIPIDQKGGAVDRIIPAAYEKEESTEQRKTKLTNTIHDAEASLANSLSMHCMSGIQSGFMTFIDQNALMPLKLKRDQYWIGLGSLGVLSAKYTSPIIGVSRSNIIKIITFEPANMPGKVITIDLIHPIDTENLRKDYVPFYSEGMRRKSILAVDSLTTRAGDDALPKIYQSLRTSMPADGEAMVARVKEVTGIDLTEELSPKLK